MTLPYDICRCHDSKCPERETCERWLQRETEYTYQVHSESMRILKPDGKCQHRIPVIGTEERK